MMYYAILSEDVENSLPLRKQARGDHLARLERLKEEGRLLMAGPHPALDTTEPGHRRIRESGGGQDLGRC